MVLMHVKLGPDRPARRSSTREEYAMVLSKSCVPGIIVAAFLASEPDRASAQDRTPATTREVAVLSESTESYARSSRARDKAA